MTWTVDWGEKVQSPAIKARIDEGVPTPFWDNRPMLTNWNEDAYHAFWSLSSDRTHHMDGSPGRIPFASIDRWASRFGPHDPTAFREFYEKITHLDAVFVKLRHSDN